MPGGVTGSLSGEAFLPPFSSAVAFDVLDKTCELTGLDGPGAELIRLGQNAIFRLAGDRVVVRVARGPQMQEAVEREVAVARWLTDEGFPAVRLMDGLPQPLRVDGFPVTFWEYVAQSSVKPTYEDLGRLLRALHDLPAPRGIKFPRYDPLAATGQRIEAAAWLAEEDREFLYRRRDELVQRCRDLALPSPVVPIHGDAHVQNLLRRRSGEVVVIDLEAFALGHPEWDLAVVGTEFASCGWSTPQQYAAFVDAYGLDVTASEGFPVLRDVQEFKMTTWLMQNVAEGPEVAEEFSRRLAGIRDPRGPRDAWQPF